MTTTRRRYSDADADADAQIENHQVLNQSRNSSRRQRTASWSRSPLSLHVIHKLDADSFPSGCFLADHSHGHQSAPSHDFGVSSKYPHGYVYQHLASTADYFQKFPIDSLPPSLINYFGNNRSPLETSLNRESLSKTSLVDATVQV